MNFDLSDEQRMLQDSLRRMLQAQNAASDSVWIQLSELGVFAALFSEERGGFGGSGFDLALVFEELGRAGVIDPVIDSTLICGRLVGELAVDSHSALLERIVNGDVQLAFAHGEPQARYDLNWIETTTTQHVLEGRKSIVVNAEAAELLLVSARTAGLAADKTGIALYLVPADAPGVTLHNYDLIDGSRAAEIEFDSVQLIENDCLSSDAFSAIENAIAAAIVAQCAQTLGAMETAAAMTCEYLGTREQFGRPIGTFQALAHRVADMMIELEQARSAVILAAGNLEAEPLLRDRHMSAAKNLLGRAGKLVAEEAIQMHGGIGMTEEYLLGHFVKRIIMADHRFGDTDHHLERFVSLDENRSQTL